jgi:WD40 repeat protein
MDEPRAKARIASKPRWPILVGVAVIGSVVVCAGFLGLSGGGKPAAGRLSGLSATSSASATLATPPGTGIVARLPSDSTAAFSWSPDGKYLLVTSGLQYTSRVYDRFGKLVSQFGSIEGWLDASHLIDGSGYVSDVATSHTGGPTANSRVVASGHGAAAIIVAVPGCTGDPIIDWYRDGKYVKTGEKATPYGWSPDGKLALLGHFQCEGMDAELHGWKGPVDVVDFATGKVLGTAPGVRGEMAFSPDGSELAAQSDTNMEIVDLAGGTVETVPGARFLGWLDTGSLHAATSSGVELVDLDAGVALRPTTGNEWQAESPTGLHLRADTTGTARQIVAADGSTLLDLSSAGLIAEQYPATTDHVSSWLQPGWWSPDGGMIALKSADGQSLVMLSVDPSKPGSLA